MTTVTRTISTSALLRTMSNKLSFGRDAKEFLASIGVSEEKEIAFEDGARITALVPTGSEKKTVRVLISNRFGREEAEPPSFPDR